MTTTLTLPLAGELWPEQGGTSAGIMFDHEAGLRYHLIVSGDPGDLEGLTFGGYGERTDGCDSTWDGQANTTALIASTNEHPAAQRIAALNLNGHSDWYLPSQRELSLCWATVPHLFRKDWYWSSTQYSATRPTATRATGSAPEPSADWSLINSVI